MTRFDPAAPLRGALDAAARQVDLHRAAIVAAMAEGESAVRELPRRGRHGLDAERAAQGASAREVDGEARRRCVDRAAWACAARARRAAIDVGNAGTLLRLLPGWLAGQPQGELDARRRRVDPPPPGRPRRRAAAADGRRRRVPRRALPPLRVRGAPLRGIDYRLPVASAQVKSCVLLAGLCRRADDVTSAARPATTPSGCCAPPGPTVRTENASTPVTVHGELPAQRVTVEPAERLEAQEITVPRRLLVGGLLRRRRLHRARQRGAPGGHRRARVLGPHHAPAARSIRSV